MGGHWSFFFVVVVEKSITKGTWGKFGEIKNGIYIRNINIVSII